jgi:hypothetical protein
MSRSHAKTQKKQTFSTNKEAIFGGPEEKAWLSGGARTINLILDF